MTKKVSIVAVILLVIGCATAGTPRLSRDAMDDIVVGKTTQRQIVQYFGYPEAYGNEGRPMFILDQDELRDHLYRNTLINYEDIPPGKYEAWHYFWGKKQDFAYLVAGTRVTIRNAIIVFDNNGRVYRKFFSNESDTIFNPFRHRTTVQPKYEELK
jgi:hypothetical protein